MGWVEEELCADTLVSDALMMQLVVSNSSCDNLLQCLCLFF